MTSTHWGVARPLVYMPGEHWAEAYKIERCECGKVRGYGLASDADRRAAEIQAQHGFHAAKVIPISPEVAAVYGVEMTK